MTFNEKIDELLVFCDRNIRLNVNAYTFNKLRKNIRALKKAHQKDIDDQYMKAFDLGLEAGHGITKAIYNSTKEIER